MATRGLVVSKDLVEVISKMFVLAADSIHGPLHWGRVRDNGLCLATLTGADPAVVELFALFHDSRRVSDGKDPDHGRRAAVFVRSVRQSFTDLSEEQVQLLAFACQHHSHGLTEAHVTVQTCWDADRLDLGRVGITPEPQRLCTWAAKDPALIEWALMRSQPR